MRARYRFGANVLCSLHRFSGSHDGAVRVWSKRSLLCMKVLQIHKLHIHTMAYDGTLVFTGSSDRCVLDVPVTGAC